MDADESLAWADENEVQHAAAAEIVRDALVRLRGGAPFLSPTDSALLVRWLDERVTVARILAGLELAANKRLSRRVRAPLELRHAKRFVTADRRERVSAVARTVPQSIEWVPHLPHLDPVLQPLLDALRATLDSLVDDPETRDDTAARAVMDFFGQAWTSLGDGGRARYLQRASDDLGDFLDSLDEGEASALLEAHGRALLRADADGVSVSAILAKLEAAERGRAS